MNKNAKMFISLRYAAQSKTVATEMDILGVDITGPRIQEAPVGSGTSRARPPAAMRRTRGEDAVGTVVVASTQELERPCINTVVVGGAGAVRVGHPISTEEFYKRLVGSGVESKPRLGAGFVASVTSKAWVITLPRDLRSQRRFPQQ